MARDVASPTIPPRFIADTPVSRMDQDVLNTADLYDAYPNDMSVAEPIFRDFGGRLASPGKH